MVPFGHSGRFSQVPRLPGLPGMIGAANHVARKQGTRCLVSSFADETMSLCVGPAAGQAYANLV
jgi:hypothetical protein